MNRRQAIDALKEGKKITHTFFSSWVWFKSGTNNTIINDENTCRDSRDWWSYRMGSHFDNGWSVWS